jgi:hypothetical protein
LSIIARTMNTTSGANANSTIMSMAITGGGCGQSPGSCVDRCR